VVVALCLVLLVAGFALIWRGIDVRIVLFALALIIGAIAGAPGEAFRKTAESLANPTYMLPICSAMAFAYVVRDAGCVDALVRLLMRPILRAPYLAVPGCAAVALVVNSAIGSQTSTLAAVGSLMLAFLARLRTPAALAGTALIFGASIAGAIANPGVAEVTAAAKMTGEPQAGIAIAFGPGIALALGVGLVVLFGMRRMGVGRDDEPLPELVAAATDKVKIEPAYKAIFPPLPILWLLLAHPLLPWHEYVKPALLPGLEVFSAMLVATVLTTLFASNDRPRTIRAFFEGLGFGFAHVITIIAVSVGVAKALELAGVLDAFMALGAGSPIAMLGLAFIVAFLLAGLSGSGTASSIALMGAMGPHAAEHGVVPLALAGVILFGAEAGRTTSPVSAVLLFGSALVNVPPRQLVLRLLLPCLLAALVAATYVVLRFQT
jgi:C4-dicarboxylate transporter, DcuC family